jgi:predicted HicB family RNase H-like nuclease
VTRKLNSEAVQLYLPPNLAKRVRTEAARLEISLTEFIRSALRDSLGRVPGDAASDSLDAGDER